MASTKAKGTAPKTPTSAVSPSSPSAARRPLNGFFLFVFLVFAGVFAWLMRVETGLKDVPVEFLSTVEAGRFQNGTPLESWYTGIAVVDGAAKFLVSAFLTGPAGWDAGVRLQQAYFLVNFFPVVCVWTVEGSRRRNAGRLLSCVTLFSLIYQFVGAGIIMPLYYALYVYTSRENSYHYQGREIPIGYARAMLPTVLLGYLAPTVAMYYIPWSDIKTVQYVTAFWQPFPLFICILLLVLSVFLSWSTNGKNADVKYLKLVYLIAGLVATVTHVSTIYTCVTSSNPQLSFSYVFLPDKSLWKTSTALGLHYIFQWDFWGAYGASLVWCWVVVYDVLRLLIEKPSKWQMIQMVFGIGFVTLVAGPGTAIVTVWNWREDRLVMIENGVKGTWKKPKVA